MSAPGVRMTTESGEPFSDSWSGSSMTTASGASDQRPASQRRTVRLGAEGFNLVPALDAEPTSALSW